VNRDEFQAYARLNVIDARLPTDTDLLHN